MFSRLPRQRTLFDNFFDEPFYTQNSLKCPFSLKTTEWNETKDGYKTSLDVPGVPKENIKVSLKTELIDVEASFKLEESSLEERYYHFTLTLPKNVDTSTLKANVNNGVLYLTLSKTSQNPTERQFIPVS